jgi:protein-S-isoprenylcysteine O-methyltransferase Ste14
MSAERAAPLPADAAGGPIARVLALAYGIATYVAFLGTFLYLVAWSGDFLVSRTVDSGAAAALGAAIAIDVGILSLFAVQHTIMARATFKHWWTRFVPAPLERSTFVLFTVAILILMILEWRPLPDVVWRLENPVLVGALWALFWLGWVVVLVSTFLIDHFELFGLKQVFHYALGKPPPHTAFRERLFYRHVRHPLMLGFLIAFWSAPTMTQGRLLFCVVTTVYILLAIRIEERELVSIHGEAYEQYRRRVPMLIPTGRREA